MNKLIKLVKKWLGIYSFEKQSINWNYFVEEFEKGLNEK